MLLIISEPFSFQNCESDEVGGFQRELIGIVMPTTL